MMEVEGKACTPANADQAFQHTLTQPMSPLPGTLFLSRGILQDPF